MDLHPIQVPEVQIDVILRIMRLVNPVNCLEIGSWCGNSSLPIAREAAKNNGILVCVDHWLGNVGTHLEPLAYNNDIFGVFLANTKKDTNIIPIKIDSQKLDFLKDGYFDFCFIDGDHRYSATIKDINLCRKLVRKGGIISGHDLQSREWDERWIETDFVDGVHHGVTKAVSESFKDYEVENMIWWVVNE